MKKMFCLALSLIMVLSALALSGCGKTEKTLKMGLGVEIGAIKATDATEDKEGQGSVEITGAVVTVDQEGKIVACVIDTAANSVKYTADGKAITDGAFQTKYELGDSYNMKLYGGAVMEWYEQVDAFTALIKGKTLSEVRSMVADDGKGNAVIAAGCTVAVGDWVLALEKAYNNAVSCEVTASHSLKLGVHTEQSVGDADGDKNGKNQVETTFFAAAVDADDKIVHAIIDCAQVIFAFDATGASATDISKAVSTKRELGDSYNMKLYGGAGKEWYEQADAFAAACIGKNTRGVASLMNSDNYGTADIKGAGCTILVNGFVKAAAKLK